MFLFLYSGKRFNFKIGESMFYRFVFYFLMYMSKHIGGPRLAKKIVLIGLKSQIFFPLKRISPKLKTKFLGKTLSTPFGLSSDFDRNGRYFDLLAPLGITFGELGSFTLLADSSKEKSTFLLSHKAIHTHASATPNPGIGKGVQILAGRRHLPTLVGASLISFGSGGEEFKSSATAIYGYGNDYHQMASRVAPYVDYVSVNLSHPSMSLAQMLSDETTLLPILLDIKGALYLSAPLAPPKLTVKVPYDLSDLEVKLISSTCQKAGVDAIIVAGPADAARQMRSLFKRKKRNMFADDSFITGVPLKKDVLALVKRFYLETRGRMDIVAAGGIFSAQDAYEAIEMGASCVQLNSVLLYKGPDIVLKMIKNLGLLMDKRGQTVASLRGAKVDLDTFIAEEEKKDSYNKRDIFVD